MSQYTEEQYRRIVEAHCHLLEAELSIVSLASCDTPAYRRARQALEDAEKALHNLSEESNPIHTLNALYGEA